MKRMLTVLAAVLTVVVSNAFAYEFNGSTGVEGEISWGVAPFVDALTSTWSTPEMLFPNRINLNANNLVVVVPPTKTLYLRDGLVNTEEYAKATESSGGGYLSRTTGANSSSQDDTGTLVISGGVTKARFALKFGTTRLENANLQSDIHYAHVWGRGALVVNGGNFTANGTFYQEAGTVTFNAAEIKKSGSATYTGDWLLAGGEMTLNDCTFSTGGRGLIKIGGSSSKQTDFTGTLNINGGTLSAQSGIYVGNVGTGYLNLTGGTISHEYATECHYIGFAATAKGFVTVGEDADYNIVGNGTDGAIRLIVGEQGEGTLTLAGGFVGTTGSSGARKRGRVIVANQSGSKGTIMLNGGQLWVDSGILGGAGESALIINGGECKVSQETNYAVSNLTVAAVGPAGGVFNTDAADTVKIKVSQPLTAYEPTAEVTGGFIKNGAAKLVYAGANTYRAPTRVAAGTLAFSSGASLPYSTVSVDEGATFALANSTMEIGGVGVLAGTFKDPGDLVFGGATEPGGKGTVGTTTLPCKSLAFAEGATLNIDADGQACDCLEVNGPVNLDNLAIKVNGSHPGSLGPVLRTKSALTGTASFTGHPRYLPEVRTSADGWSEVYLQKAGLILFVR